MSLAIARPFPTSSLTNGNSSSHTGAGETAQPVPRAPHPGADTVTLTVAEQVFQLYNEGQRVSQIADNLRLTVDAVNSYLGIAKAG